MNDQEMAQLCFDTLVGGCTGSVEAICEEHDHDDTFAMHAMIDEMMFNCTQCGWWCWAEEMASEDHEEWRCGQCVGEDEDCD